MSRRRPTDAITRHVYYTGPQCRNDAGHDGRAEPCTALGNLELGAGGSKAVVAWMLRQQGWRWTEGHWLCPQCAAAVPLP